MIANNPFAGRPEVEPNRLLVLFHGRRACDGRPGSGSLRVPCEPEELRIEGRELYIYYPNGMARPRIPSGADREAAGDARLRGETGILSISYWPWGRCLKKRGH